MSINNFFQRTKKAANTFLSMGEQNTIHIFSHIDTDGLTSAAIVVHLCNRMGKKFQLQTFKQLQSKVIEKIEKTHSPREVLFVDFGSGQLATIVNNLKNLKRAVILDHHIPERENSFVPFKLAHCNPHYSGYDGGKTISAAGVAFFFAYNFSNYINEENIYPLAVTGALGDSQVDEKGKLTGLNRKILEKAKQKEIISEKEESLRLFGKEYKPLYKALATTFNPVLPGISGSTDAALNFLKNEIGLKKNVTNLKYSQLRASEKEKVTEELLKRLVVTSNNEKIEAVRNRLFGVTYLNQRESSDRLKDLREFSTVLNSCGRMGHPEIGIRLALGERGEPLKKAEKLYERNRRKISNLLKKSMAKGETAGSLFIVDGREWMEENFASVIASILSDIKREVNVLIVFSHSDEELAKVSLRVPQGKKEENLKSLVENSIRNIEGASGGGHKRAAGAYVPYSSINSFITNVQTYLNEKNDRTT